MNFKKTAFSLFLVIAIVGSVVTPVSAAGTLYVGTSGTNDAVTYDTIQDAVDNASDGDTIEVAPGTYNESITVTEKNLTINRDSSVTSGTVTIDATNAKYGDAFYNDTDKSLTLGSNVETTESIVTVDPSDTGTEGTYGTISDAVDNASDNTTVSIVPGEYNESINVTSQYVGFVNDNSTAGNVTIDATNTSEGNAFTGEYASDIRVGQNVVVQNSVMGIGGGALGDAANAKVFGIPAWAIVVVALLLGYVYYEEQQ